MSPVARPCLQILIHEFDILPPPVASRRIGASASRRKFSLCPMPVRVRISPLLYLSGRVFLLCSPISCACFSAAPSFLPQPCNTCQRFFVDKVAKHLFLFEGNGVVRDFQGTFTEYLDYRQDFMKPGVRWHGEVRGWGGKSFEACVTVCRLGGNARFSSGFASNCIRCPLTVGRHVGARFSSDASRIFVVSCLTLVLPPLDPPRLFT